MQSCEFTHKEGSEAGERLARDVMARVIGAAGAAAASPAAPGSLARAVGRAFG